MTTDTPELLRGLPVGTTVFLRAYAGSDRLNGQAGIIAEITALTVPYETDTYAMRPITGGTPFAWSALDLVHVIATPTNNN